MKDYSGVFVDELPNELPPRRGLDFEINLKSDQQPPVRPVIQLSHEELKELKRQLQVILNKGLIGPSSSPCGAPEFFVKKKKRRVENGVRLQSFEQDHYFRLESIASDKRCT